MKYIPTPEIGDSVKLLDGTVTCIGSNLFWKNMNGKVVLNMSFHTCDDKKFDGYFKAYDHQWQQVKPGDI